MKLFLNHFGHTPARQPPLQKVQTHQSSRMLAPQSPIVDHHRIVVRRAEVCGLRIYFSRKSNTKIVVPVNTLISAEFVLGDGNRQDQRMTNRMLGTVVTGVQFDDWRRERMMKPPKA